MDLRSQYNLVSRLITPIITPSILIINLLTKLLRALNLNDIVVPKSPRGPLPATPCGQVHSCVAGLKLELRN